MLRLPSLYLNRVDRIYAQASLTSVDVDALVRLGSSHSIIGVLKSSTYSSPLPLLSGQIAGPDSGPNRILDRVSRGSHDEQEPLMMAYHSNSNSPYIGASINLDDPNELEAGLVQANIDPTQAKDILLKLNRFRHEWEGFIDGLVKEWKTLNVVSALLISALLTVFQIEEAQFQPVTRTAALLSLISAFLSLMFGGMYILRFSTMRTMRKAHKSALLIDATLPGNGRHSKPPTDSNTSVIILFPRVLVTVVFFTGFVYFCLVLYTFRKWALPTRDMAPTFGELIRNSTVVASGFATPLRAPRVFNAVSPLMSGSGRRDGFKDLASINMPGATREERMAAMMDQHETRSTHSAPSMLGLDVSPSFGTSPFLIGQTLPPPMTATPPTSIPSTNNLPVPPPGPKELVVPLTTITEASPMTTEDPLMGAEARWAKAREMESGDEVAHSSTFERRDQASALDSMLPAPLQPLSMIRERTEGATSSGSGSGVAGAGSGSRFAVLSNVGGTDSAAAGAGGADGEGEKGKKGWKLFGMGGKGGDGPKSGEVAKEKKSPMGRLNDLLH
ncbi:hypothetical protein FRC17_006860 [Serendipita sp. 399]|nr:hypothetical protein FRC17_006860 [Serendipita sp. 399]